MLRVISGTAKGRNLIVPDSGTRPVTDRIKTVVFDLVREYLPSARVIDLFAGSGAYGIEALSRGASFCHFIDNGAEAIAAITANLASCEFPAEQFIVTKGKLPGVLTDLAAQNQFDLIFIDPPFTKITEFQLSSYSSLLTADNLTVLRWPVQLQLILAKNINLLHSERLGESSVYFLRKV